jgi:toxin ParE1/3/4
VKLLRVSAAAERDLDDIWHYIATNSGNVERANKFVDAITQRLSVLAHSPKAGTARAEIDVGLRGLPIGDYIVYYRENKRWVIIS